ncbi:MAG: hypothetical protein JSR76_06425 [Verrucomicrobia bacterium]|nr:hypothetical protein [Verrucomicrobiota bacterium]
MSSFSPESSFNGSRRASIDQRVSFFVRGQREHLFVTVFVGEIFFGAYQIQMDSRLLRYHRIFVVNPRFLSDSLSRRVYYVQSLNLQVARRETALLPPDWELLDPPSDLIEMAIRFGIDPLASGSSSYSLRRAWGAVARFLRSGASCATGFFYREAPLPVSETFNKLSWRCGELGPAVYKIAGHGDRMLGPDTQGAIFDLFRRVSVQLGLGGKTFTSTTACMKDIHYRDEEVLVLTKEAIEEAQSETGKTKAVVIERLIEMRRKEIICREFLADVRDGQKRVVSIGLSATGIEGGGHNVLLFFDQATGKIEYMNPSRSFSGWPSRLPTVLTITVPVKIEDQAGSFVTKRVSLGEIANAFAEVVVGPPTFHPVMRAYQIGDFYDCAICSVIYTLSRLGLHVVDGRVERGRGASFEDLSSGAIGETIAMTPVRERRRVLIATLEAMVLFVGEGREGEPTLDVSRDLIS